MYCAPQTSVVNPPGAPLLAGCSTTDGEKGPGLWDKPTNNGLSRYRNPIWDDDDEEDFF